jgi:hypothetical protein
VNPQPHLAGARLSDHNILNVKHTGVAKFMYAD